MRQRVLVAKGGRMWYVVWFDIVKVTVATRMCVVCVMRRGILKFTEAILCGGL